MAPAALVALSIAAALGVSDGYPLSRNLWLMRCTGWGALTALCLALCTTPVSRLATRLAPGRTSPALFAAYRRTFGLTAAVIAALHLAIALATYLRGTSWDALDQPFLRSGLAALGILVVLAVTSFKPVIRRAQVKLWKPLHRLVYAAGLLAFHHALLAPFAPRVWVLALAAIVVAVAPLRFVGPRRRERPNESA